MEPRCKSSLRTMAAASTWPRSCNRPTCMADWGCWGCRSAWPNWRDRWRSSLPPAREPPCLPASRRTPARRHPMSKLRVFLADDHAIVREGLKALINAQADLEVVGEASDGALAVEQ